VDVEIIGLTVIVRNKKNRIIALTNTPCATGDTACNLLADWSQQLIAILLRDSCSKMYTDFTVLSFPVYIVLYLKLYFFVRSLLSRSIFIRVVFSLLWYDIRSCGLLCHASY